MRYILTNLTFLLLISLYAKGQANEYPKYSTDSSGNKKYILFTIEEAQQIDNDEQLLKLYRIVHKSADSLVDAYIAVVNNADSVIALLQLKTKELDNVRSSQNSLIMNLQAQIADYKKNVEDADKQLKLKDEVIGIKDKQIKKQKRLKLLGFGVGAVGIIVAVIALL